MMTPKVDSLILAQKLLFILYNRCEHKLRSANVMETLEGDFEWNELKGKRIQSLDRNYLKQVFQDFAGTGDKALLSKSNLGNALATCGLVMSAGEVDNLFRCTCFENDATGFTLDEFECAVQRPSRIEKWASQLSLPKILAICMSSGLHNEEDIEKILQKKDQDIKCIVGNFAVQIKKVLLASVQSLIDDVKEGCMDGIKEFQGGKVDDFHQPLTDRIGWPNTDFINSMEQEHRSGKPFKIGEREISPEKEYDYVTRRDENSPPIGENSKRVIPDIDALLRRQLVTGGNLTWVEVVAVVLYTGPMKSAYNDELRKALPCGEKSSYSTSIFVLTSAIVKLTKLQRIPTGMRLYRGVRNVQFPNSFQQPDPFGRRGITEYAFMSTTQSLDIAIQYAYREDSRISTIFEIEVGSVDRGANIKEFSQYEHENEFLWTPGTFMEPYEKRVETFDKRTFILYRVRAKSNLKVMTIEELLSANKDMHLASFGLLIRDVKQSLEKMTENIEGRLHNDVSLNHDESGLPVDKEICTAPSFIKQVLAECESVRLLQKTASAESFSVERSLLQYTREMLETATMARNKVLGYLHDDSRRICFHLNNSLRTCHREWTSFLRRRRPVCVSDRADLDRRLCVDLGLIADASEGQNALGEPWLVAAAADGRPKRDLLMLLSAGELVNCQGADGATALHAAAKFGYDDSVEELLAAKADLRLANNEGQTPVWIAAQNGEESCLRVLLGGKADVNTPDKFGGSPLWVAAQRGHDKILSLLVDAKANVNAADDRGDTPSLAAAYAGHAQCIRVLSGLNADVGRANNEGYTPLMMAAQTGSKASVEALIAAGVDLDVTSDEGWSAAQMAAESGSIACLRLLHEARADLRMVARESSPPLESLLEDAVARERRAECMELLRELSGVGPPRSPVFAQTDEHYQYR